MMDRAKNMALVSKGRLKQTTGSAVGNDKLVASGLYDQCKGHLKQFGVKVKDAFRS